jgi:hypothetical protein
MHSRGEEKTMKSRLLPAFNCACAIAAIAIAGHAPCQASSTVLATSGFNDQSGINSNATPNSPFQIGLTVNGQGAGESGWDTPWLRLGGFDDRAPVSTEFVREGDAATKLFADNVFGTSIERAWFEIVPVVRIDAYILVRPAASMRGNAVHTTMGGEIPGRTAAYWDILGNGEIRVFDKEINQSIPTGFSTLPNAWNKYSLVLNTTAQTWKFLFNDRAFRPAQPLTFLNPTNFVDRVNLQAAGTLNSYVDAIAISEIPVDYDRDGDVDAGDYNFWKSHFHETTGIGLQADGNRNGVVDAADYVLWRQNFHGVAATQAVPEPGSCMLTLIILLGAAMHRCRCVSRNDQDDATIQYC